MHVMYSYHYCKICKKVGKRSLEMVFHRNYFTGDSNIYFIFSSGSFRRVDKKCDTLNINPVAEAVETTTRSKKIPNHFD
jgi:hypothetical protein